MSKKFYSDTYKIVLDETERLKKAKKVIGVIKDFYRRDLKNLNCLDIGCSGGIITNYLAKYFIEVRGIDVDENAIKFAKKRFKKRNLSFYVQDTLNIGVPDNYFDVIVCNQIYQYVNDKNRLLKEIYRVLKPEGFCYFAATSKISFKEKAFLTCLPKWLRKTCFKDLIDVDYLTYFGLKDLVKDFEIVDYSVTVINDNKKFYIDGKLSSILKRFPNKLLNAFLFLFPSYIWILKKRKHYKY